MQDVKIGDEVLAVRAYDEKFVKGRVVAADPISVVIEVRSWFGRRSLVYVPRRQVYSDWEDMVSYRWKFERAEKECFQHEVRIAELEKELFRLHEGLDDAKKAKPDCKG